MKPLEVLFEDNHLIAVFKPHRMPTQGDLSGDSSLLELTKAFLKEKYRKPGGVFLGLLHRIDRPVAGVVLFAKTSKAASRMSEKIRSRNFSKTYIARVEGELNGAGKLVHQLYSVEGQPTRVALDGEEGKRASLEYRALSRDEKTTVLEIQLHTGRKHQIRCQLATVGHPIVGDGKYGAKTPFKDGSIALLAKKIEFEHPTTGKTISIEVPSALSRL